MDTFRKIDNKLYYPMLKPQSFLSLHVPESRLIHTFEHIRPLQVCTSDSVLFFVVAEIPWNSENR